MKKPADEMTGQDTISSANTKNNHFIYKSILTIAYHFN